VPYFGEIAALTTAMLWAGTSIAFALAGRWIGALAVNQIRIVMALVMLPVLHLLLLGSLWPESITWRQMTYLAVSGVIGLSLGDLCYFHSLAVIGPRLGALLMSTWPIFCAVLAWPMLGELLGVWSIAGIGVTLGGVLLVLGDRSRRSAWSPELPGRSRSWAIVCGLLGALGQASGLVIAKLGMQPASGAADATAVDPLSATLIRMVAAGIGIWIFAALGGQTPACVRAMRNGKAMWATFVGALLGPTFGVWMSLVAAAHTDTGIAATLMATMPILALPLARITYGSRPGRMAIWGTLIAFAGVALLFLTQRAG
jgi:drug/metabolite transporter (DMT)-like permease